MRSSNDGDIYNGGVIVTKFRTLKSEWVILLPVVAVLLISVACGEDSPTPQPTPTPFDVAGLTTDLQKSISEAITAIDVPEAVSEAQIRQLVEGALAQVPEGLSAADVQTIVDRAVTSSAAQAVDQEDVARAIAQALAEAAAAAPDPLTGADVDRIVRAAIPPTPTPAPTATPAPTPTPILLGRLTPRRGGTITLSHGTTFPNTWDPHPSVLLETISGNGLAYNQIVEYDETDPGIIVGDLAESWFVSEDGLTYSFKLRKGVKWMDGRDFTADDVVFSIDRIIEPGAVRPSQKVIPYIKSAVKVDDQNVNINLNFPSLGFIQFLAVDFAKVVPKHIVEAGVDISLFENGIGTGPYSRLSFEPGATYEVERNPNYFKKGLPFLDGFKAILIQDKGTEIAAYRTERTQMSGSSVTNLDIEDYQRLEQDTGFMSRFGIHWIEGAASQDVMVNTNAPPFDNEKVRRAMFLALDRGEITETFGPGGRYARGAPMAPQSPYTLPESEILSLPGYRTLNGEKHPDDIAEAQKLMVDAGFPDGFSATFSVAQIQDWPDVAQVVKEQMKVIGIDLDLVLGPINDVIGGVIFRNYEVTILGIGLVAPDPDDSLLSNYTINPRNWHDWSDPRVEELAALQKVETDFRTRRDLVFEMQRIILNGSPAVFEYTWRPFGYVVSDRIRTEGFDSFVPAASPLTSVKKQYIWLEPE